MLVNIFYHVDEFCKLYEATLKTKTILDTKQPRTSYTEPRNSDH